jgi:hypothetical protein
VKGGIWQLRVRNTSTNEAQLDVWTLDAQGSQVVFSGTSVQDNAHIGSPGASKNCGDGCQLYDEG